MATIKKIFKWGLISFGAFMLVGILLAAMMGDKKQASNAPAKDISAVETKAEEPKAEEPKKETPKPTKPVTLGAGEYITGKDYPAGRYKATNVGRGSNFFVYGEGGGIKVNTILGNGDVGDGDYTFWTEDGDKIKTNAKVKLIPVE